MRWLFLLALLFATPAWSQALVVPTCGGLNLTAGTPHNVTVDINGQSCRVGGGGGAVVVASTWSLADATLNGLTLSDGGVTVSNGSVVGKSIRGSVGKTSGKLYVEFYGKATSGNEYHGFADGTFDASIRLGFAPYSTAIEYNFTRVSSGFTANYTTIGGWVYAGGVVGLAIDFSTGGIWIASNGVWVNGSDPATGSLPIVSFDPSTVGALFPALFISQANEIRTLQATAASQKYAPPAGFTAWDGGNPGWKVLASTSSANETTTAIDTTGADLLVVYSSSIGSSRPISDSYGNSWSVANEGGNGGIYYCHGGTVGPGHTFTVPGASYPSTSVVAFSGSAANPMDQISVSDSSLTAGPITPSVPNALVVTATGTNGAIGAAPAGFTLASSVDVTANLGSGMAYQTQTTPTAVTANWNGNTQPVQSVIVSFKSASALKVEPKK